VPPEPLLASPLANVVLGSMEGAFLLAEWTEPGRQPGPPQLVAPLHMHHRDDEAWYVLEGTLRFRLGDREVDAPAGAAVFGPHGVPHTFWNPEPEPARYLLVMTPDTLRLIEEIRTVRDRGPDAMKALYRRYGCDILDDA
jgi:mannose-6-phosphate isomerase-like protein (cupin superfamily)